MSTQKLTALKVRHATEPGRYGDGDGLYLNVRPQRSTERLPRLAASVQDARRKGP